MQSRFHQVDGLILLIYLTVLLGIGFYFSKKQETLKDFVRADGQRGWLPIGLSLMAAINSGIDYIQTPAIVYAFGIIYFAVVFTWLPVYCWTSRITLPLFQSLNRYSVYEYLELRFDLRVRTAGAGIYVLWRVGWMGTALYVPCLALRAVTGVSVDTTWMIVVLGIVVTIYTMLGGMKAVIWTDVVQFCIMFGGLLGTVIVITSQVPGGVAEVFTTAGAAGKLSMTAVIPGFADLPFLEKLYRYFTTELTFVGFFCYIIVAQLTAFTCDQVNIQRLQCTRSAREAKNAFIISSVSGCIWTVALGCVGLALLTYYNQSGETSNLRNDNVLLHFIATQFPKGMIGLVIAAIFAASLSSVDSAINATTSIIVVDFYQRHVLGRAVQHEDLTPQEQARLLRVSRLTNLALGALVILVASQVERFGELYTAANKILGAFFGPLLGIFALGMFTKAANSSGVIIGALLGLATSCFLSFFSELTFLHPIVARILNDEFVSFLRNLSWQWPAPLGVLVTIVTGYLASLMTFRERGKEEPLTYRRIMDWSRLEAR